MQSAKAAFYTLVVLPSGSKYGWDDVTYMQKVNELVDWIDAGRRQALTVCDYALVNFGVGIELEQGIALAPHLMRHSEYIDE